MTDPDLQDSPDMTEEERKDFLNKIHDAALQLLRAVMPAYVNGQSYQNTTEEQMAERTSEMSMTIGFDPIFDSADTKDLVIALFGIKKFLDFYAPLALAVLQYKNVDEPDKEKARASLREAVERGRAMRKAKAKGQTL